MFNFNKKPSISENLTLTYKLMDCVERIAPKLYIKILSSTIEYWIAVVLSNTGV